MNPSHSASAVFGVAVGVALYAAMIVGLVMLSIRWSRGVLEKKITALSSQLTAAGARLVSQDDKAGLYRGREATYEIAGRRVMVNAYFVSRDFVRANLRVPGRPAPAVTLYPEGALERFGKALRLNREVQLGDDAFDEAVYVDAVERDDERVRALLAPPALREAARELLTLGFKVHFTREGVEAFQVVYALRPLAELPSARVTQLLTTIVDLVPRFDPDALTPEPARRNFAMIAALVGAALAGGMIVGGASASGQQLLDPGATGVAALVGVALWIAAVAAVAMAVRGSSRAMRSLLLGVFVTLFTVAPFGAMMTLGLNRWLDDAPVQTHDAEVLRVVPRAGSVELASWRPDRQVERIAAAASLRATLTAGDRVRVRVHPGRFGWSWAERVTERAP